MYLLDSNAWIAAMRNKSPPLEQRISARHPGEIVLCSVVLAELWYGVCRGDKANRLKNEALFAKLRATYVSLPLDDDAALDSGELRDHLATLGKLIGTHDLLIASIARTRGLTLVTHNTAEFSRVPNLLIEDWQIP